MSKRSQALAEQFERANAEAIAAVERCSDAEWRARSRDEGWPVGFTAWHIGDAHPAVMNLVNAVANEQPPPPITSGMLDGINAEKLTQHASAGKAEALDALRTNGAAVAEAIRALSDEQLDRTATLPLLGGKALSAQQLIENGLIGHARAHLASMRAAAGAGA
jgi:uncharacterized damage-inducible protein DinB